jgi:hypothetical protein
LLITSVKHQLDKHVEAREGLTKHFNYLLEKILNENSHKEKYWILGKTKIEKKHGKEFVKPFLQACDEKPGIIRESFVYEVDNTRGVKTLLWVMHPGDMLSFPTLGKSIRVTGGGVSGSTILLPRHR